MSRFTTQQSATARFILSIALVTGSSDGWAARECWLDVYDNSDFQGAHARIEGPVELGNLTKLNGADWSDRIESLAVGGQALVYAFRHPDFKDEPEQGPAYHGEAIKAWGEKAETYSDQEITFGPGKKEHHLGELNFHRNINSLKIKCRT
jgi:hypothetical protein